MEEGGGYRERNNRDKNKINNFFNYFSYNRTFRNDD